MEIEVGFWDIWINGLCVFFGDLVCLVEGGVWISWIDVECFLLGLI